IKKSIEFHKKNGILGLGGVPETGVAPSIMTLPCPQKTGLHREYMHCPNEEIQRSNPYKFESGPYDITGSAIFW
ncbi:hypothetical protein ACFLZM_01110, partial [Thermodesulfobacteriota bacterium]